MKGHAIPYSTAEMDWLEENRLLPISEYHAGFVASFGRQDVSAVNLHSLRKRKGWRTGRTGQFEKGRDSWNKGLPHRAKGSEKGWFKKGNRSGFAVKLYQPIGTERLSKEGYLERKIHDGLPYRSRWRAVHLVNWEAINGPLPAKHCLKCIDGNKLNTDPSNWTLIPRAMLPRLNGGRHKQRLAYDDAPAELRPTIMAIAKIEQRVFEVRKDKAA